MKAGRTPPSAHARGGNFGYDSAIARPEITRPLNAPAVTHRALHLEPHDPRRLSLLCGQFHEHLKLVEQRLSVEVHQRGQAFTLSGSATVTTDYTVTVPSSPSIGAVAPIIEM